MYVLKRSKALPIGAVAIAISNTTFSQSIEPAEDLQEAYYRHSTQVETSSNPSIFLPVLLNDLRQFGSEHVGLDPVRDGQALFEFYELDLLSFQQSVIEPYMDEICMRMQLPNSNLEEIADLYRLAQEEEKMATARLYEDISASLSSEGYSALHYYMSSIAENGSSVRIDWAGLANDVPEYTRDMFSRMCEPTESNEELNNVLNQIIDN